jgi:hypothetical protein
MSHIFGGDLRADYTTALAPDGHRLQGAEKGLPARAAVSAPYSTAPLSMGRDPTRASGSPFSAPC